MMVTGDPMSPENTKRKQTENGEKGDSIFSPRFRSVAAMAGWDEEALLNASLVVEDTPERDANKQKRRSDLQFKTPPTNSRRKRRAQRKSPVSIPVAVLNLDDDETSREVIANLQNKEEPKIVENGEVNKPAAPVIENRQSKEKPIIVENGELNKPAAPVIENRQSKEEPIIVGNGELSKAAAPGDPCPSSGIPCMDKLREELSCAICLEICYEPSTTTCGHSFCKKCLRSAADKCGKRCPKCRQLISNGRSCTVNTVLWNTIQLLFPQEVEARKAASVPSRSPPVRVSRNRNIQALNSPEGEGLNLERRRINHGLRNRSIRPPVMLTRGDEPLPRRSTRDVPSQDEDAALAMRLQREEFMGAFRAPNEQQQRRSSFVLASSLRAEERQQQQQQQQQEQHRRSSVTLATTNLRAMASRAANIRLRGRPTS